MMSNINNKYKTTICRHWEQTGNCQMASRCHFAHGKEELRSATDPMPGGMMPRQQNFPPKFNPKMNLNEKSFPGTDSNGSIPSNFKTVTCKYFEKGFCKYQEKCNFAHGDADLRPSFGGKSRSYQGMGGGMSMGGMNPMLNQGLMMSNQPQYQQMGSPTMQQSPSNFNSNPMNETAYQNQIAQMQLESLIQQLEAYHENDETLLEKIQAAKQQIQGNNIQGAATALNEVIQRTDKEPEDEEKYNEFIANIQELGSKMNQSYPQQQQYTGGPSGGMMTSPMGGMMGGPSGGMMSSPMGGMMGGPTGGMMGSPNYYGTGSVPMMQQNMAPTYNPMMMQQGGGGGMMPQKYNSNGYRSGPGNQYGGGSYQNRR
mmetsp:Transcript_56767/g.65044  ORF Transcript_56767/g.65044 Transcript_56767/m.65044 type:complete len:370 (+) Transcript_56767:46-1155(+)